MMARTGFRIGVLGATAGAEDVPMRVAGYGSVPEGIPLLAIPRSPALVLVMTLQPIAVSHAFRLAVLRLA